MGRGTRGFFLGLTGTTAAYGLVGGHTVTVVLEGLCFLYWFHSLVVRDD